VFIASTKGKFGDFLNDKYNQIVFIIGIFNMAISPFARDFIRSQLTGLAGLPGDITSTQKSATENQFEQAQSDWRVKLSLAPSAFAYLYNADSNPKILAPLSFTKGVIFPYTPQIQVNYAANYESTDPVHSNYKIHQYRNSEVGQISITATFTAQDTAEANYMLAVIHFFKSVTKMFYGQDEIPLNGTPPPLCFLSGLGTFQFNNHPIVISNFNYTLPDKVDYIRAQVVSPPVVPTDTPTPTEPGAGSNQPPNLIQRFARLGLALLPGGQSPPTVFSPPRPGAFSDATYVPTQMQIQLTALPIVTRNVIRNKFSLKEYASGDLTRKGIW
jgi:hypothetical protein